MVQEELFPGMDDAGQSGNEGGDGGTAGLRVVGPNH